MFRKQCLDEWALWVFVPVSRGSLYNLEISSQRILHVTLQLLHFLNIIPCFIRFAPLSVYCICLTVLLFTIFAIGSCRQKDTCLLIMAHNQQTIFSGPVLYTPQSKWFPSSVISRSRLVWRKNEKSKGTRFYPVHFISLHDLIHHKKPFVSIYVFCL